MLFEPFDRSDLARSRSDGVAGLGPAITRSIAERHGGTVHVEDTPGGGATFALTLPSGD